MSLTNCEEIEGIYKIFDTKAKTFGCAITHENEDTLTHFIKDLVNTKGAGVLNTHPEDFCVFHIGYIEDNKVITSEPKLLFTCASLIKKHKPQTDNLQCKSETK